MFLFSSKKTLKTAVFVVATKIRIRLFLQLCIEQWCLLTYHKPLVLRPRLRRPRIQYHHLVTQQ